MITLEAVELRGERPDTEVIFIYTDTRHSAQRFAKRTWLWKDPYRWALDDAPGFTDRLRESMNRFAALAVSTVAVGVAAGAPAATAAPISKATQFHTGNRSVTCGIEIHAPSKRATEVLCAAAGIPAPKTKGIGDPGFVQLNVLGKPQLLRLSQDSFVAGSSVKLGRGRLWNQLGVTCHVAQTTVMCFNGDNHGFVIGNGHYKSF